MASNKGDYYLLVASSRAPQLSVLDDTVKRNVFVYSYNYETSSLNDILVGVHRKLQGRRVAAVGMLLHSMEIEMMLCFAESKVLNERSVMSDNAVRSFFLHLSQSHLLDSPSKRLDFFNSCLSPASAECVAQRLGPLLKLQVGIWKDFIGGSAKVGDLYFDSMKLQKKMAEDVAPDEKLKGYEKIRTVGKGAFGTAVLYRNTETDTLVVIKEINMIELSATERQMALNEAQVLSLLNHQNIVSYYRSFERDGTLMIEMEYADGGTLAQLLSRQTRSMPERDILTMLNQIAAALQHMHQHNILHRDLKTANVFLTKESVIKVGDFGISKAMTTKAQAQTVLGTPYYISPEMCEGKQYGEKSDIWALGCILYEMACLRKPFQGTSLPALVNNIMKGYFEPLPEIYSMSLRKLVQQLLQREPSQRPTASHLLNTEIPQALELLVTHEKTCNVDNFDSHSSLERTSRERSNLYLMKGFQSVISLNLLPLPPRVRVKQVSISNTHFIVLTAELTVLTWGGGSHGQLGQGDTPPWRATPTSVPALGDRSVRLVGAGDGFSVFVTDSGMLMTCGDGSFGCLGHGDWNSQAKPKLIEKLLEMDVSAVSCGPRHVAVLAADSAMYTWGQAEGGRLGLGHERDCCSPSLVRLPERTILRSVECGTDCTMAIAANGSILACGRNTYNKLGLSDWKFFPPHYQNVTSSLTLRKVTNITAPAAALSLGASHTAVLLEDGYVITMGRNGEGQLGHSTNLAQSGPSMVTKMEDIVVSQVVCGPTYTVAVSVENVVFMWGTRYQEPATNTSHAFDSRSTMQTLNASSLSRRQLEEVFSDPKELLALYASPQQITKGNTVIIGGVYPVASGVLVLVHTTIPLPKKQNNHQNGTNSKETLNNPEPDPDTDSLGPIPEWMKSEIAQSEAPWQGFSTTDVDWKDT